MYSFETLNISVSHHIAEVVLNTSKKGNPFGPKLWIDIAETFVRLSRNNEVRCIILRTEKKNFSYGLDLMEAAPLILPAINSGLIGQQKILDLGHELQHALNAISETNQPVIVAIKGWCIGAGLEMAAACDIRLCTQDTKFSLREVRVGMVPDLGGIQRLAFVLNEGHLREMAFTGSDYSASWALQKGLINDLFETSEEMKKHAFEMAKTIAKNPPRVVSAIKGVMNERLEKPVRDGMRKALRRNSTLMQSKDFQEAITSFMEKRNPVYTGD